MLIVISCGLIIRRGIAEEIWGTDLARSRHKIETMFNILQSGAYLGGLPLWR